MTRAEILKRLRNLIERVHSIGRCDTAMGWEIIDLEKDLEGFERTLASQTDSYMANRFRIYNAGHRENVR